MSTSVVISRHNLIGPAVCLLCCVYDNDHMSELQIKNTSESDPRSYEVT